ncbi:uncharacterized protein LOC133187032 [Saccostrea echinata]|uniref:uncharacterized protein LOC133187032 n=1 Tax=Saccostrea echinata TaxID=191078 RepID=UPI002A7F524F|nr:uncharacterized protein LOC133187032 [Saccostrea echinata]
MSEHPCHNLSNTEKQIFTCRHCMAKFYDPIQRWRHSKSCKKEAPPKSKDVSPSPNGTSKREYPAEHAAKAGTSKKRQKKENPLNCLICKSVFNTLEEMKEHVKQPCNKPFVPKSQSLGQPNPDLENFEHQLQQLRDAKGDDMATNQIESLLKAAQTLHKQQQEQQRQQAQQLQNVETEVIPDGGNPDWLYNQGEPVLCSMEEYGGPGFPNYSSIDGSDGMHVVRVEQVSSTPPIDEDRSLHTPPISLTTEEYHQLPSQEITLTSSGQEAFVNHAPTTLCGPVNVNTEKGHLQASFEICKNNTQGCSSNDEYILSTVGIVENLQPQTMATQEELNTTIVNPVVLPSVLPSVNPGVIPSEVRLVGSDGVTVTVVLSSDTSSEVVQKTGNPVDEFDLISQVIGEDLNEQRPVDEKSRKDSCNSKIADTATNCDANKAPKFSFSPVSNFVELKNSAESEQAVASEQGTITEERKYSNTSENLKHNADVNELATINSNGEDKLKSKECLNSQNDEQIIGSHLEQLTSATAVNKCLSDGEKESKNEKSFNFQEIEKSHDCENQKAVQNERDHKLESDSQISPKEKNSETYVKSVSEVKVIKKKPRTERIPKCRVCDKQFKTTELLRKHNKVPCMIRLTRNLTQKVLRPKRLEKPVPLQTKKKKKQKPVPNKPKMITLINRRFSDTSLDFRKDKKGKLKTRRKSLYDFNFCITRSSDYRNASLDVLVQYDSLDEKEQHFFHLGLVAKVHLPTDYKTPKSLIKHVLKENGSRVLQDVVEEEDVHSLIDEPPVLEKVVDAAGRIQEDIYILRDEINHDIEPPVLMTVEELNRSCPSVEEGSSLAVLECPSLSNSDDIHFNSTKGPMKDNVNNTNELNKENNFERENVLVKSQLTEQNSKPCTPSKVENSSEKFPMTEVVSPLKSPNKTLGERHFLDAIDVSSDTFSDESEFTKTKLRDDATKPSYSVTVGLQTDIPTATDKIMYPRSSFILKCLKRLENKHKNVPNPKPLTQKQNSGRKNLFESLENVSRDSKTVCKSNNITYHKENQRKNLTQSCSEKRDASDNAVEEVIVYPKPVDPKKLEHNKPTFTIPSNEEILTYADDNVVIRKPPELDSVSPENGRDLLQIIAKTLGIFPSTKPKHEESHLNETPKRYKEKCQEDVVNQKDGMQIIVMNNTAESNEYTMGIDVINVPKSINDELKEAASELESKVVFEDDGSQRLHFCDDSAALVGGHSVQQGVGTSHNVPGDISIPEEVYEFLEDYNTIQPSASKTDQIPTFVTQDNTVNNSIHLIPGPQVKASEVVDIHFSFCSSESLVPQPNSHVFSLSKSNDETSIIPANHIQSNKEQEATSAEISSIKTGELRSQQLEKPYLQSHGDLPMYAIPVGVISDDNQNKKQINIPQNEHAASTFLSPNQHINTCKMSSSTTVYEEGRIQVLQTSNQEYVIEESQIKPAFSDSDVFVIGKVPVNDKEITSLPSSIPDTNPDPDQLWNRILEDYKTECLQNQRTEQNNYLGSGSIFNTPKQHHRPRTLSNIEINTNPFISKPELTRSYSHSANSSFCDRSNQKLRNCDNRDELPSMTCSFSPTNNSHSLKLIFRKEKSPQEQKTPTSINYSEQVSRVPDRNFQENVSESNMSSALSDPSSTNVEGSEEEGDSLPYMIVDTGVEICRKALGAEEDEDMSEDEWALEKETDSQDAVT